MTDERLAALHCPECKYRASDDADKESDGLPYPVTDAPKTYDEALEFFEALGADEGCVFCPRCKCEFNVESGQPTTDGLTGADIDGL